MVRTVDESARIALACLDLTSLNDGDNEADILRLAERAAAAPGRVAALCVWPRFVRLARAHAPPGVAVAAVANFPEGSSDIERALRDTGEIMQAGAQEIDLVVGSWNASIASVLRGVDRVETLDAPWLARGGGGMTWSAMLTQARRWRDRHYDIAINFEGDIRSHLLMARSGAPVRVGFDHAGGGPLLTPAVLLDQVRPVDRQVRTVRHRVQYLVWPRGKHPGAQQLQVLVAVPRAEFG